MKTAVAAAALVAGLLTAVPASADPYEGGHGRRHHHGEHHPGYAPQPVEGCHYVRQQVVDAYGRPLFDEYGRKQWRPVRVCH